MTKSLKKAGYDTTRLEAHVIAAKALGAGAAAGAKRKRDGDGESMDVDGDGDWEDEDGAGDDMDVDDTEKSTKRAKANSGGVVLKGKTPQTNRQMVGFRNVEVRLPFLIPLLE